MKAVVKYITLNKEQRDAVNLKGWEGTEVGKAYLAATFGFSKQNAGPALALGLYEDAALVDIDDAEDAWLLMQNVTGSWAETPSPHILKVITKEPRSMMTGDIIEWENGKREIAASVGWKEI